MYQNLKDDDYFNLNNKPIKYQNDRFIEALFLAISKLHIATALHENDPFFLSSRSNEVFYFTEVPYNNYFTGTSLTKEIIKSYSKIYNEWIGKELTMDSIISGSYMKGNIPFYLEALSALEDLKIQMDISRRAYHGMMRTQTTINGYLSLWYKDRYKAWTTIMLGRETLFTEVLSFESLKDSLFNKNFGGGIFQTQHMKQNNKQSCSLYHLLLTNNRYHQTLEQMSAADQRILKSGVATLVKMGLNGEGSGPNGEITEENIRDVFTDPQGDPILFGVKSRATGKHESGIPILTTKDEKGNEIKGLWDYHFSDVPFNKKLVDFNDKIRIYRLALEQFKGASHSGKKAFLKFLENAEYDNLKDNFYDDAEQFANELDAWAHINPKIAKLAPLRRITRFYTDDAKVLFKIEQFITLDKFI